mgnify:CR=1 FL=1
MCNTDTDMAHDEMQKAETEEVIWGLGLKCVLEVELTSKIETDNQRQES